MYINYILLISWLGIFYTFAAEFDFTIEIPSASVQCFFQSVDDPKHVKLEFDYQVNCLNVLIIASELSRLVFRLLMAVTWI